MAVARRAEKAAAPVSVLDQPYYTTVEAARLLGLSSTTLARWLDGYTRAGVTYRPVIRPEPTGQDTVTWGEFVEAGYLREYRERGVSLFRELRPFIDQLRQQFGVPYPLAHERPFVHGGRLVVQRAQKVSGLPTPLQLYVTAKDDQVLLAGPAERFLDKVEFTGDVVTRLYPAGKASPVVIDSARSFGVPQVANIRTEIIAELFEAGEYVEQIAEDYDLDRAAIEAALRYELSRRRRDDAA
jgi:uncharacterized protein (DUF433 family)